MELSRMKTFLRSLARHGNVNRAAREATPNNPRGAPETFWYWAKHDLRFGAAFRRALSIGRGNE